MFNKEQPSFIRLRDIIAERVKPIVFWVGSGLSAEANLPLWGGLILKLAEAAKSKVSTMDEVDRKYREKKISMAQQLSTWDAVSKLKEVLGETSFKAEVRDVLSPNKTFVTAPEIYQLLWKLRPSGLLNLNLDRLATRAYVAQSRNEPTEFTGNKVSSYGHVLRNLAHPFITNLHGVLDDAESWVLTRNDLKTLLSSPPYKYFINTVFGSRTVVFVGMSADDVASGGFLEELSGVGILGQNHYWITSRRDDATDRWAENFGIEVIRYSAPDNNHSELNECFNIILAHIPREEEPPPVVPNLVIKERGSQPLPPPDQLAVESPEIIREMLNAHAIKLLENESPNSIKQYESFFHTYKRAIHNAWYTSTAPPENIVLGHELIEEVGRGAFGRVFKARHIQSGEFRAVKILWEEARESNEMLNGFRRGVRSMRILSERKVKGMVAYRDTYEIPAIAVMDFVEGPNLEEAVSRKYLDSWESRIQVALSLARIIRAAHTLPERVLHRDIRPANVMLRNYYSEPESPDVVVLDFDLSWHMGEKSVSFVPTKHGYIAPEQIGQLPNTSTRNAAVDSFGFGMTLFFICSGRDPGLNEHITKDWEGRIVEVTRSPPYHPWRSLNARIGRLILSATKNRQQERWDMGQIEAELDRLNQVIKGNTQKIMAVDIWTEELAARINLRADYSWDEDSRTAAFNLKSGLSVKLIADESNRKMRVLIEWLETGNSLKKNIDKYLPTATTKAIALLRSSGFYVQQSVARRSALLEVQINVQDVKNRINEVAQAIEAAASEFYFE